MIGFHAPGIVVSRGERNLVFLTPLVGNQDPPYREEFLHFFPFQTTEQPARKIKTFLSIAESFYRTYTRLNLLQFKVPSLFRTVT